MSLLRRAGSLEEKALTNLADELSLSGEALELLQFRK
jgi:hypothetical protein